MVELAQLVRAPGCGPGGRGFESHISPQTIKQHTEVCCFCLFCCLFLRGFVQNVYLIMKSRRKKEVYIKTLYLVLYLIFVPIYVFDFVAGHF